jgi:hypothetical protein
MIKQYPLSWPAPHHTNGRTQMTEHAHWLLRFDKTTGTYVIELSCGADRIAIPGGHATHQDAYRQAQMLMSASMLPIVDRAG